MKKQYFFLAVVSIIMLSSCGTSETRLEPGASLSKQIVLGFDDTHVDFDDWVEFEVKIDSGLQATFSKGTYDKTNGTLFIDAEEYLENSEPIHVSLTSNTEGTYAFALWVSKSSDGVDLQYGAEDQLLVREIEFVPIWKVWLPLVLLGLVVVILIVIVVAVRIKKANSFNDGFVYISSPIQLTVELGGKSVVNISNLVSADADCRIVCETVSQSTGADTLDVKTPKVKIEDESGFILKVNDENTYTNESLLNDKDTFEVLDVSEFTIIKGKYKLQ